MATKITKSSTVYSENPKMDTSGIRASRPSYAFFGKPAAPTVETGGKLYMAAIEHAGGKVGAASSPAKLKEAAKLVGEGFGCSSAVEAVKGSRHYDRAD